MDWNVLIERNREKLRRILAMLVAMAGAAALTSPLWGGRRSLDRRVGVMGETQPPPDASRRPPHKGEVEPAFTLPRHLHRAILALLRPAEAAARRLVIVAARGIVVPASRPRKVQPKPGSIFMRNGKGTGILLPHGVKPSAILPGLARPRPAPRSLTLPLLDPFPGWPRPRRAMTASVPRISAPGFAEPHRGRDRHPPLPSDAIDATRLVLRLQAVGRALDDLPAHARRFARWQMGAVAAGAQKENHVAAGAQNKESRGAAGAQKENHVAAGAQKENHVAAGAQKENHVAAGAQNRERPRRISPLRPGRPPGSRRRPTHEVHEVLADLHHFAFYALEPRDNS